MVMDFVGNCVYQVGFIQFDIIVQEQWVKGYWVVFGYVVCSCMSKFIWFIYNEIIKGELCIKLGLWYVYIIGGCLYECCGVLWVGCWFVCWCDVCLFNSKGKLFGLLVIV